MRDSDLERALFVRPRFKTLGFLVQVEESDYPSIQDYTGLSLPDLSKAVSFLNENGLVHVRKEREGRYQVTIVRASDDGVRAFRRMLKELKRYGVTSTPPT
ncbi:MAG: transcriptional regulator [Mycetocola sp.]